LRRRVWSRLLNKSVSMSSVNKGLSGREMTDELLNGIDAYTTSTSGFFGIMKHRYTDFVVRECTADGTVLYLNSTDGSEVEKAAFPPEKSMDLSDDEAVGAFLTALGEEEGMTVDESLKDELSKYLKACMDKEASMAPSMVGMACASKEARTAVHKLTRKYLAKSVDSAVTVVNETTHMVFKAKHLEVGRGGGSSSGGGKGKSNDKKKKRDNQRRTDGWPQGLGDFLEFTLMKVNVDTLVCTQNLAQHLRCKESSIGYGGTKDKRGVTAQRCTVYRRKPSDFQYFNRRNHQFGALSRAGDFKYVSESVKLGDLSGNRFSIVLRDVKESPQVVEETCKQLKELGFLNYFGLQRFGRGTNPRNNSANKGVQYIKGNWRGALCMLLNIDDSLDGDAQDSKPFTEAQLAKAESHLGPMNRNEGKALASLKEYPLDFSRAVKCVPRTTRLMCSHAYQSLLFNRALTERINRYGLHPVVGDLVSSGAVDSETEPGVKHIVQEDLDSSKYSMADVLLPLIGHASLLPLNDTREVYTSALAEAGLSLEYFKDDAPAEFRFTGAYRAIMSYPKDFQWRQLTYHDPDEELVTTELGQYEQAANEAKAEWQAKQKQADSEEQAKPETKKTASVGGPLHAVHLEFTLPPGTYATMFIREMSKKSTSPNFYAALQESAVEEAAVQFENSGAVDNGAPPLKKAKTKD